MLEGFIYTNARAPDPIQCPQCLCVHKSGEKSFKGISKFRKIVLILSRHRNVGLILVSTKRKSQLSMIFWNYAWFTFIFTCHFFLSRWSAWENHMPWQVYGWTRLYVLQSQRGTSRLSAHVMCSRSWFVWPLNC